MPQEEIRITIEVRCPYCNSDEVDFSNCEHIRVTGDGFEVEQHSAISDAASDELEANHIFDNDNLLCGYCDYCDRVFAVRLYCPDEASFISPDIRQREAQILGQWRDLTFGFSGEISLSPSGIPVAIALRDVTLKFSRVSPAVDPHREQVDDVLYYGAPYGRYGIETREGRMELWINHELAWRGDELRTDKRCFVGSITKLDGYLERYLRQYKVSNERKEIPVRFPVERILQAAYRVVFRTETLIRNRIWTVLCEKYGRDGGKWYKSILGPELAQRLFDRAKKSGDKHLSRSRLQEYFTLGECAKLIEERWDKDFAEVFERAEYLLRDVKVLEDYRNSIAHFRHMDFDAYDDLVLTCSRLRNAFE
jgi:hypothetical protein